MIYLSKNVKAQMAKLRGITESIKEKSF